MHHSKMRCSTSGVGHEIHFGRGIPSGCDYIAGVATNLDLTNQALDVEIAAGSKIVIRRHALP